MKKLPTKRRILIVGEGRETEFNYFVGFKLAFEKELEATATSVVVRRGNGGDARRIVTNAIQEMRKFQPDRKRGDRVFLLLDTEGPGNSPGCGRSPELPAAEQLAAENGIEIVYSSPAFEYWLLCHFLKPSRGNFNSCAAVVADLNKETKWKAVCNTKYDKTDQDIFDRLCHLFELARLQSLEIDLHHVRTKGAARRTNPSTQVYELIALLIGAHSGGRCPIAGTWKLVDDERVTLECNKGENMPTHRDKVAHWRLGR